MVIPGELLEGKTKKVNVAKVKAHMKDLPSEYRVTDDVNILEKFLLRQLPAEQINGVLSMFFAFRSGATDEEIENALVSKILFRPFVFKQIILDHDHNLIIFSGIHVRFQCECTTTKPSIKR